MKEESSVRKPKIVTIDIETSPLVAYSWGPVWETNLIECIEEGQILSFSAKWFGGKQVTKGLPDYRGYKKGLIDDKKIVTEIHKILEEADVVIGHNSNKFDLKYINSRFLKHKLPPPAPYKSVDTCTLARRYLKLPSYKLNDLGEYFELGKKVPHSGFDLWKRCMAGDPKAWATMLKYNKQDTKLTEDLYVKLRPYMKNHPNLGMFSEQVECPKCTSTHIQWRGTYKTVASVFRRFQCQDCGAWGRDGTREYGYKTGRNI